MLEEKRLLPQIDDRAEAMLADALQAMPGNLKRRMLLTYLGFPYYDIATLPLARMSASVIMLRSVASV